MPTRRDPIAAPAAPRRYTQCACGNRKWATREKCQACYVSGPRQPFPLPALIICPHCGSCRARIATCCACDGTGKLTEEQAARVLTSVWARPRCGCEACRRARPWWDAPAPAARMAGAA
jgi:hypothetical protein